MHRYLFKTRLYMASWKENSAVYSVRRKIPQHNPMHLREKTRLTKSWKSRDRYRLIDDVATLSHVLNLASSGNGASEGAKKSLHSKACVQRANACSTAQATTTDRGSGGAGGAESVRQWQTPAASYFKMGRPRIIRRTPAELKYDFVLQLSISALVRHFFRPHPCAVFRVNNVYPTSPTSSLST